MVYIHKGILFSHKIKGNPAICGNIDKPGGHYAKWNKPDRKRQILYGITYIRNQKN